MIINPLKTGWPISLSLSTMLLCNQLLTLMLTQESFVLLACVDILDVYYAHTLTININIQIPIYIM